MSRRDQQSGVRLLSEVRTEIGRADSKAGALIAVIAMATGLFTGLAVGHGWSPARLSAPAGALWWAGIATLAAALFAIFLAVLPRYRKSTWEPGQPLGNFGDIQRAAALGGLSEALRAAEQDPLPLIVAALAATSGIAARKYFWIRCALAALSCTTLLLPTALLLK
ncbi:Pycsar system effector family protein [Streptomyces sp. NPDC006711]|uniref:Pycsar system effector family protein n=1 Tax=Streptomyces sp. NPDC006711 TaxID=3364762 RepID=UPI003687E885